MFCQSIKKYFGLGIGTMFISKLPICVCKARAPTELSGCLHLSWSFPAAAVLCFPLTFLPLTRSAFSVFDLSDKHIKA